ncbi:MAG: diaminopropionate ammonia-lyase [Spirochaetia bacterium]|jgi:diaminopropionate ammonia-lyase|nr:diaminopropionate ammonia-lyase [Spirochaetia bacterium]
MEHESDISWIINDHVEQDNSRAKELFPLSAARLARRLHSEIPDYSMTRLAALPNLSRMLQVEGIYVKDEGQRMGLNSFKVMGGSFALFRYLQRKLGLTDDELSFNILTSPKTKKKLGTITFASATDGNHGKGIAWAARLLGHRCVIYVHSQTSQNRIDAIKQYGAEVKVIPGNYDHAVRTCGIDAKKYGWEVISDTSWKGYTVIPTQIMQGYNTMLLEAQEQFSGQGISLPTHVFIQAGVGALAASVIGFYTGLCAPENRPKFVVVEPSQAACIFASAQADDGKPHTIDGSLSTIMAGLACGEPSPVAWDILKRYTHAFLSVPDYVAARGMRIMAVPLKGDPMIISGESGAVTLGALYQLLTLPGNEQLKQYLGLGKDSRILIINTEGNTDPTSFRQIIWDGQDPVPKEYVTRH